MISIARLAKMMRVEEVEEMQQVKIARKKSHLVATIKLCSSGDFY